MKAKAAWSLRRRLAWSLTAAVTALWLADAQRVVSVHPKDEHISYVVRDAAGKVVLQSSDADLARFPVKPPLGFFSTESVRAYTVSSVKGTIFVTTVEGLAHRRLAVWKSVAA